MKHMIQQHNILHKLYISIVYTVNYKKMTELTVTSVRFGHCIIIYPLPVYPSQP